MSSITRNSRRVFWVVSVVLLARLFRFSFAFFGGQLYHNYKVYKIYEAVVDSSGMNKILEDFATNSDSVLFPFDFRLLDGAVHAVVAPHKSPDFEKILDMKGLKYNINVLDLQQFLNTADNKLIIDDDDGDEDEVKGRSFFSYDWKSYKTVKRTYKWINNLVKKYPQFVELVEYGESYEGQKLYAVKISRKQDNRVKPGIFIEGGIHAREWVSSTTATYIIMQLLASAEVPIRNAANEYDWYIVPHVNPDGFAYSQTTDRLWRKTRTAYGKCFGADMNRNFGFYWKELGASDNPCASNYAGPKSFSEKETLALSKYIASLKGKIHVYIALHSFSQVIMYPNGYSFKLPENAVDLQRVADVAADALEQLYGTKYKTGSTYRLLYAAAGTSMDWVYGEQCIQMAFTYELRPELKGQPIKVGMQLPTKQIEPTGQETLHSIIAMINEVKRLGYFDYNIQCIAENFLTNKYEYLV